MLIAVKRGHEVELEYSKREIINKMNTLFGYNVVERLKFISFDDSQNFLSSKDTQDRNVTINKYQNKIKNIKNDKIKKSLLELAKVFEKK